ncbi:putative polyketide hydroxylase [Colletotrichum chlorophyti]|uniref:Putative polyketide hydroxylase n=1 Tax=Colletotrichum chlorophyti TaxID=708187 RepID=A0A1Q8RPW4_9PEZI|nr:putative polyketide hydroxylase [Colletotrichum chlorophyti]
MTVPGQAPVIIIGGSLIGLASALFLSARNVPLVLIERHTASSLHPRAIGYTSRTLELLETVGIPASALRVGPGPPGGRPRRVNIKSLAGEWQDERHWNSNAQPANGKAGPVPVRDGPPQPGGKVYAPILGTAIAQDRLEPILRKRAVELGADLRLGWKMTKWNQTADGVSVTAVNKQGEEFTVEGSYIIACDGARSVFREDLGIGASGVGHLRWLCSMLFRCPPIEHYLERGFVQFNIEGRDDGFEAFLVSYPDKRWALMLNADAETAEALRQDEAAQRDQIRKAVGLGQDKIRDEDIELVAIGHWEMSARIAERFSEGRVFLAGDAAHTLPPNRGGYGANTGFADAHNLAWKIAAVMEGKASEGLLGTYDEERRPVALVRHDQLLARDDYKPYVRGTEWAGEKVAVIDDIAMELGQIYRSAGIVGSEDPGLPDARRPDEWKGQPGTRAPHVRLLRDGRELSSLDLFCKGWVLLSASRGWEGIVERAVDKHGVECEFVHVGEEVREAEDEDEFEEIFGASSSGAVLVRPDGFIACRVVEKGENAEAEFSDLFAKVTFARK